jgi:3-hydroxyethyl bacteriochlorophyllide a dehydrogenase
METVAVVLDGPERLSLRHLDLLDAKDDDVVVDIAWSGISTGTERLFWTGQMPPFPGMGYPLVPGYESVGRVVETGAAATNRLGEYVFVPGASCFKDARGLFGGAAKRLVVPSARAIQIEEQLGQQGVLLALAATAYHAIAGGKPPELIVGHGVLGRLLARITIAMGAAPPTVWETNPARRTGSHVYPVLHPDQDPRKDYATIMDASGAGELIDTLVGRLARGGEIALAGFYSERLSFAFVPTFKREARLRVAAEWAPEDLAATNALLESGGLSLHRLITHERQVHDAKDAYGMAFGDSKCLKMVLDWRHCA